MNNVELFHVFRLLRVSSPSRDRSDISGAIVENICSSLAEIVALHFLKMYSEKLEAGGSIEGVAIILSSFISWEKIYQLGGRAMSAPVSNSTWVQLHLILEPELLLRG